MATPKQLREVAQDAARKLREARARQDQPGAAEHQVELDTANSALNAATGTSVDITGTVVAGFADQLRVEGRVSVPQGIAESRLRLREAGIDAEELDDAAVRLRERHLDEAEREQAVNDLINKHSRQIIGAPRTEDLSPEEKRDQLGEIGHREVVGATLGIDPTQLTAADFARFERLSGHDAVIDAVLGTGIPQVERADARSKLRNQEFEGRLASTRPGSSPEATSPPADPPGSSPDASNPPAEPIVDDDPGDTPEPPGGSDGGEVTGDSDPPEGAPPDGGPAGDPDADEVTGGSDPPEGAPPGQDDGGQGTNDSGSVPAGSTYLGSGTFDSDDPALNGQPADLYEDPDGNVFAVAADGTVHPVSTVVDDTTGDPVDPRVVTDGGQTTTTDDPPPDDPPPDDPPPEDAPADPPPADPPPADPPPADPPADPPPEEAPADPPPDAPSAEIDGDPEGPDGVSLPVDLGLDRGPTSRRDPRGGSTDPADDAGFEVRDPSVRLPSHAELGQSLFGNPGTPEGLGTTGGGANVNPGADSQGAGVTDPSEEHDLAVGSGPEDDPFAGAGGPLEPSADRSGGDDPDAVVSLVPSEIEGPVDDGPDLPDIDDLP